MSPTSPIKPASTGRRVPRCPRYARRGQALIMAVLIMFLLAGLGGLFVATLNQALVQTARAEERIQLEEVAEAGLRHAQTELLISPDGADWRPGDGPDDNNRGWVRHGEGFYRLTVTYGPTREITTTAPMGENPLDRFVKIDVEAVFTLRNQPANALQASDPTTYRDYVRGYLDPRRFLMRRVTAFMPINVTDYLLWVTNREATAEPTVLGPEAMIDEVVTTSRDPYDAAVTDSDLEANSVRIRQWPYLSLYNGPIHVAGDLQLGPRVRIDLTSSDAYKDIFAVKRHDLVEVAGALGANAASTTFVSRLVLDSPATSLYAANSAVLLDPVLEQSPKVRADVLRRLQTLKNNPLIRRLKPPSIDRRNPVTGLHRYRALTADSALWDYMSSSAASTAVVFNPRMLGWGEGIYLGEEYTSLQYGGDLARLRDVWLSPDDFQDDPTSGWVNPTSGEFDGGYHPEAAGAVEVILHDWGFETAAASSVVTLELPYIELRRHDGKPFYNKYDEPQGSSVKVAYPRNGVLYAEGNLIVKGNLPASLAFEDQGAGQGNPLLYRPDPTGNPTHYLQMPGGAIYDKTVLESDRKLDGIHYIGTQKNPDDPFDLNRRYDLTIVSGGTIYLEGNVLGPVTRRARFWSGGWTQLATRDNGSLYDSKLALLARDNVCLNPTKFDNIQQVAGGPVMDIGTGNGQRVRASEPLEFTITTAGAINPRTRLLLRHAGVADVGVDYAAMRMLINGTPFEFGSDPGLTADQRSMLFFGAPAALDLRVPWMLPFPWTALSPQRGGGLYPADPLNVQRWDIATRVNGFGATNTLRFEWLEGGDYLYGSGEVSPGMLMTGLDVQVDALLFAQRGSWFIIPGKYYNDPDNPVTGMPWPYPKPGEPLDVRLIVHGAIVENHHAPPDAEEAWTRHWRGSDLWYFDLNGDDRPDLDDPGNAAWDANQWRWTTRRMGIEYHYDATLMRPVCYEMVSRDTDTGTVNIRSYRPRLPKLPVCPSVFSIGTMQTR